MRPKAKSVTVCSCHVAHAFQSECTLYSCLKAKELLARSRPKIWSLGDCNWTQTQNHLVRKRTLNHLAKWLSVRLRTKWFWVWVQLQSQKVSTDYRTFKQFRTFYCLICQKINISKEDTLRSNDKLFFWEFRKWKMSPLVSCVLPCHVFWLRKNLPGNCRLTSFPFSNLSLLI